MEKMMTTNAEESKNVTKMADLEYHSTYLQRWMQLNNSGVPHDGLLVVLPPPDGIQLLLVEVYGHKSSKNHITHSSDSSSSEYSWIMLKVPMLQ
jgi:hypothetical protein